MATPAREVLGAATCPLCKSKRASVRLGQKQLSYLLCNSCNIQLFTRSDISDGLLRELILSEPAPASEAPPEPVPAPAPTPAAPAQLPPPAPAKKPGWGLSW